VGIGSKSPAEGKTVAMQNFLQLKFLLVQDPFCAASRHAYKPYKQRKTQSTYPSLRLQLKTLAGLAFRCGTKAILNKLNTTVQEI